MVVESNFIQKKKNLIVFLEIHYLFLNKLKFALGINRIIHGSHFLP